MFFIRYDELIIAPNNTTALHLYIHTFINPLPGIGSPTTLHSVLPDRIVYSVPSTLNHSITCSILTRPLLPLEPLIWSAFHFFDHPKDMVEQIMRMFLTRKSKGVTDDLIHLLLEQEPSLVDPLKRTPHLDHVSTLRKMGLIRGDLLLVLKSHPKGKDLKQGYGLSASQLAELKGVLGNDWALFLDLLTRRDAPKLALLGQKAALLAASKHNATSALAGACRVAVGPAAFSKKWGESGSAAEQAIQEAKARIGPKNARRQGPGVSAWETSLDACPHPDLGVGVSLPLSTPPYFGVSALQKSSPTNTRQVLEWAYPRTNPVPFLLQKPEDWIGVPPENLKMGVDGYRMNFPVQCTKKGEIKHQESFDQEFVSQMKGYSGEPAMEEACVGYFRFEEVSLFGLLYVMCTTRELYKLV